MSPFSAVARTVFADFYSHEHAQKCWDYRTRLSAEKMRLLLVNATWLKLLFDEERGLKLFIDPAEGIFVQTKLCGQKSFILFPSLTLLLQCIRIARLKHARIDCSTAGCMRGLITSERVEELTHFCKELNEQMNSFDLRLPDDQNFFNQVLHAELGAKNRNWSCTSDELARLEGRQMDTFTLVPHNSSMYRQQPYRKIFELNAKHIVLKRDVYFAYGGSQWGPYSLNPQLRSLSIDIQLCAYVMTALDSQPESQEFQKKLDHYVETFVAIRPLCSVERFIRLVADVTIGTSDAKTPDAVLGVYEMMLSNFNALEDAASQKDVKFESITLGTALRLDPNLLVDYSWTERLFQLLIERLHVNKRALEVDSSGRKIVRMSGEFPSKHGCKVKLDIGILSADDRHGPLRASTEEMAETNVDDLQTSLRFVLEDSPRVPREWLERRVKSVAH
ncbi:hypothetical protein M3Y99_01430800 [Aphelenchoides fujianensis]|nr:hypothetical protein M3Y99_01427600 [Aphelenchoides fujianensis]KAI6223772.1 hypothetical protein M3Y99_01430800 [Aphelenchoides fujianensis]